MSGFNYDDITPVKLNEEEPQLCQILYDEEYKETMGLLLALLQKEEYSERALDMTEKGIELLASHYTIWNYRYNILIRLDKDLFEELDWCEQIALENEKNYQIWNYRQLIIEKIISNGDKKFDPHREFPIMNAMLEEDKKNHHVWSYRKWLAERFELYEDDKEIQFVDQCIVQDLRNNSAWTHRFFLRFSVDRLCTRESIEQEIELTKTRIAQCPQNPSSWNYLFGIYKKFDRDIDELYDFCLKFANAEDDLDVEVVISSSFALETLAKIYKSRKQPAMAIKMYDLLSATYDPIRANYWNYEKSRISA